MTVSRRPVGFLIMLLGMLSIMLTGCGSEEAAPPASSAAPAAQVAATDLTSMLANADLQRGQTLYFQCRACHSLEEGGPNKVGPNLWGIFDRKPGLTPGFVYSDSMKNSDIVWTEETMDGWLEQPSKFLPGNRMVFAGVRNPQDRANLIVYLKQETGAAAE